MTKQKKDNKDYILNIRVSRETYDKIKSKARENKESISNVVRKVINDSSEIIGDLSNEIFGTKKDFKGIVSYQKVLLAKDIKCSGCSRLMKKGMTVTVGDKANGKRFYFCKQCKQ